VFTLPATLAELRLIAVSVPVTGCGSGCPPVVNDLSEPTADPAAFDAATILKWYFDAGRSPVIFALTETDLVPDPAEVTAVVCPYRVVLPYWKKYDVAFPSGLTVACSVAPDDVTLPAL
jgi:hypothetical protein